MIITDDIMVIGYQEDERDHDKAFTQLLETAKTNNIKLNFDKIQYKQKEVECFGETYTTQGCKPSDTKVKAITERPKPENLKDLQTFLGMIQYLSQFSPRIAELAEPLCDLMKKHTLYVWEPEHNQVFNNITKEIVQAPILRYYNPKKETVLQTDASIKGLGTCLLQEGLPVCFASKSLQDEECGYAAIELESLAVAWAMEKFHYFLYASHFTVETDQKLLETILAKSLTEAAPWLQWLLICTFPYDFRVRYIKGSANQLADCLSRLGCQKDKIELPKLKMHTITKQLHVTADRLNQFHTETTQDKELALLKHIVQTGCPHDICDLPKEIRPYWMFCEEMTIEDGLLLKGIHIIVPQTLHKEMIQLLHTGHLRLEKCLDRAKPSMYFPSLYDEFKDLITNCTTCLKFSAQKPTSIK